MSLEELVNTALVGTSRRGPQLTAGDGPLGEALATLKKREAEDQLLGAAAVLATYAACGVVADAAPAVMEPAVPDTRPACTPGAHDLLERILAMSNTPVKQALVLQWLAAADRAGVRAWHVALPALMEYGAGNRAVRQEIVPAADRRGEWLMALNPRWRFGAGVDQPAETVWATGSREQRAAVLRLVRQSDAAAGRALVELTWAEDGADERAAFIAALETGLSADDEALLERALDDRSKQVRAAAAEVLARLPESALVRRMIERVEPLLAFTPPGKGGLLKRAKAAAIEVTLPPDAFDAAWARDGIVEMPPNQRLGRRQWWLQQMLRMIPPSHWSWKWGITPAECIAAAGGEFGDLLREAWIDAAERMGDAEWAEALLASASDDDRPRAAQLLRYLPAERQRAAVREHASAKRPVYDMTLLLDAMTTELDAAATRAVVDAVAAYLRESNTYNYYSSELIVRLGLRAPAEMYDELAERMTGREWSEEKKAIANCLEVLQVRRNIQRELGT